MVMTISAYSEPARDTSFQEAYPAGAGSSAANAAAAATAEEPSRVEQEEDEKYSQRTDAQRMDAQPSAFAKLLAGLLRKSKDDGEVQIKPDSKGEESEAVTGENVLFGIPRKTELHDAELSADELMEADLLKTDFPQEQLNFLHDLEHQLINSDEMINGEADFDSELFNGLSAKPLNDSSTAESGAEETEGALRVSAAKRDGARLHAENTAGSAAGLTDEVNQSAAGFQAAHLKESAFAEANSKKGRSGNKSEKIEAKTEPGAEQAVLKKEPEKESRGRLDEMRNRSRRDRVAFDIRDFRTPSAADGIKGGEMRVNAGMDTRVQGESVREITLELRLPSQGSQANAQPNTSWEAKAGSALENMLARELHQNFNGDIVRHASMALRNGGEGTIRLALKPESLGNVKIHLEMAENKITGHIVVESEEAMNAFKKEVASLEQAFRDSGYENAELDLSLTADGRNAQSDNASGDASRFAPENVASRYDDNSASSAEQEMFLVDVFFRRTPASINLLA
ncbi:MAG: flagellar hook-length control protein FliK [Treponema sp.]|jgi:flagellar hook-length control protein FliK|nr:flagellar hook-length control protein FliK [Treponema sp.]